MTRINADGKTIYSTVDSPIPMNRELTFSGLPIYGPENAIYPGEAGPYYHSGGAGLEFSWEYRAGPGVGATIFTTVHTMNALVKIL